jgi:hypothetical protein
MFEAVRTSETSVNFYESTWSSIPSLNKWGVWEYRPDWRMVLVQDTFQWWTCECGNEPPWRLSASEEGLIQWKGANTHTVVRFLSACELRSSEPATVSTCSEKLRVSYVEEFKLFADLMSNGGSRYFNIRRTKERAHVIPWIEEKGTDIV